MRMNTIKVKLADFDFVVKPLRHKSQGGMWHLINAGKWEKNTIDFVKNNSGRVFFDIGAWVGAYTLLASRLFKRVVSFEPNPVAFEDLAENLALNKITNVTLVNAAIHDYNGKVRFGYHGNVGFESSKGSIRSTGKDYIMVDCVTWQSAMEKYGIPCMAKIDIEGAEEFVMKNIIKAPHKPRSLCISSHPHLINCKHAWQEAVTGLAFHYTDLTVKGLDYYFTK